MKTKRILKHDRAFLVKAEESRILKMIELNRFPSQDFIILLAYEVQELGKRDVRKSLPGIADAENASK